MTWLRFGGCRLYWTSWRGNWRRWCWNFVRTIFDRLMMMNHRVPESLVEGKLLKLAIFGLWVLLVGWPCLLLYMSTAEMWAWYTGEYTHKNCRKDHRNFQLFRTMRWGVLKMENYKHNGDTGVSAYDFLWIIEAASSLTIQSRCLWLIQCVRSLNLLWITGLSGKFKVGKIKTLPEYLELGKWA